MRQSLADDRAAGDPQRKGLWVDSSHSAEHAHTDSAREVIDTTESVVGTGSQCSPIEKVKKPVRRV